MPLQSQESLALDKNISPPITPGYVSADEDHFSDATEGMKDEDDFEEASSTMLLENDDDVPTPTNLSPIAWRNTTTVGIDQSSYPGGKDSNILIEEKDEHMVRIPEGEESDEDTEKEKDDHILGIPEEENCLGSPVLSEKSNETQTDGRIPGENYLGSPVLSEKTNETQTHGGNRAKATNCDPKEQTTSSEGGLLGFDTSFVDRVNQEDKTQEEIGFVDTAEQEEKQQGGSGFGDDFDSFGGTLGAEEGNDGFGDDFDDFGEAVEGDDGFDDFEGFEEGTATSGFDPPPEFVQPPPQPVPSVPLFPVPILDFDGEEDVNITMMEILNKLYPSDESSPKKALKRTRTGMFHTERSESLWNQLVAPPPLQPPDWKPSRIRRYFLVSLGVPVDLDEILPASKQKKLVLPSTKPRYLSSTGTPSSTPSSRRSSTDSSGVSKPRRSSRSKSRSRTTSSSRRGNSSTRSSGKAGQPPMPVFDESSARILCNTSDLVLSGMSEGELREHIATLQGLTNTSSELLTWWLKKRDGAMGDKETFETVIESLVGYARKTRQSGR